MFKIEAWTPSAVETSEGDFINPIIWHGFAVIIQAY